MIRLPTLDSVERTPAGVTLRFAAPPDLDYFEGHFPDCPLLPGVVQIGWAIELARSHLSLEGRFRALAGVKFTRVIQPGARVVLRLAVDAGRGELEFEYQSEGGPCSVGRVLFGGGLRLEARGVSQNDRPETGLIPAQASSLEPHASS